MRRLIGMTAVVLAAVAVGLWLGASQRIGQPGFNTWGPLAVVPPQEGVEQARTEGTLVITDECVYLESGGERQFLFWPADRTTWNAESRSISFSNLDGTVVATSDGDGVVLGGGGDSQAEGGRSGEEWVSGMEWVAMPAASCAFDVRWGVGAVDRN